MKKTERQELIKQLLKQQQIKKQEDFVELLNEQGIEVTQATISRDIKEMKLIKVSDAEGSFYYSVSAGAEPNADERLDKMLQDTVVSLDQMDQFISLKTIPGSGSALGILLEKVLLEELFTLVATDDKVLLIFKDNKIVVEVFEKLSTIVYA